MRARKCPGLAVASGPKCQDYASQRHTASIDENTGGPGSSRITPVSAGIWDPAGGGHRRVP